MNKAMKIGIVVALVVVVGVVLTMKSNRPNSTAAGKAGAPGTTASPQSEPLPRLVDLGAGKCIPCKMMAPILEELRTEYAGRMRVDVYDVWENPGISEQYGVRVIPTQVFYGSGGAELWRHEGFMSKEDILAKWSELGIDLDAVRAVTATEKKSE